MVTHHYAILTKSPYFGSVIKYIQENNLTFEPHLNRTRFWLPEELHNDFIDKLGGHCDFVPSDQDLMTGNPAAWDQWKLTKDIA
jgi:hypothetical protein